MSRKQRNEVAEDTIRRFRDLPNKTLARYLATGKYGALYDFDEENARTVVRTLRGAQGEHNRGQAKFEPPVLQPVCHAPKSPPHNLSPGSWLILSDVHVPLHAPQAVETAIEYARKHRVKRVLLNGDLQDCAGIGLWDVRRRDFLEEVEVMLDWLDWLIGMGWKEIVWKPGNHEDRLDTYYMRYAPQLIDLPTASLDIILGLEGRGVKWLSKKQRVMAGKLPVFHGHEMRVSSPVNPARGLFLRASANAAMGHLHRTADHSETNIKGELIVCSSFGCLCDLSPEYAKEANRWNWGFGVVHIEPNGMYELTNLRILPDGKTVV